MTTSLRQSQLQELSSSDKSLKTAIPKAQEEKHAYLSGDVGNSHNDNNAAIAQPANRDANTPAVNTPNSPPNPGAPVSGANSFTEGQAKSH